MTRILHVVWFDYHDDYSYQENLLSRKHRESGYEVSVVASQFAYDRNRRPVMLEPGRFVNEYGIDVTILPVRRAFGIRRILSPVCIGFEKRLAEISPEIIFVHNFPFRDVRYIVDYALSHPGVRVYADSHSDYYNQPVDTLKGRVKVWATKRNAALLNKVAVRFWGTTPWRVQYMKEVYGLPEDKLDLLIMGADEKYINSVDAASVRRNVRDRYGIPQDAFLVVTGGKIDRRKMQDRLMEAVSGLAGDNVWLMAFGTPSEEMAPVVGRYRNCANIVFPGWLELEMQYDAFIASDLAVFPGTHSILWEQAVACSLPSAFRHWPGMEHVNACGNAILLDNTEPDTLKNTIMSLQGTEKYSRMKENAAKAAPLFQLASIAGKAIGAGYDAPSVSVVGAEPAESIFAASYDPVHHTEKFIYDDETWI